ncbi:MAG: flagellar basal body P-ring protein FlgI [Planctomycetota bacterium]
MLAAVAAFCALVVLAVPARGGELQEYARLRGLEGDRFVGIGLVYGLDQTGDSMKDSLIAAQPYAQLLANLGNIRADARSLAKTRSIALVMVTVEIPRTGARTDDRIDVRIGTVGNAESLKGGILLTSFLKSPVVPADRSQWVPFAVAEGNVEVDPETATTGIVRGGARMVRDVVMSPFEGDSVALVLHPQYAGYPTAASIADLVNDELSLSGYSDAAKVEDAQTIRVRIPEDARGDANAFVARLMTFSVPGDLIRTPARIVIDTAKKVITVDDRVEFRPAAVTAANLRITTITPAIEPTPDAPVSDTVAWTGISTAEKGRKSMKLRSLIDALIELDVEFDTQVAIIESLSRQGALKAEIVKQ